MSLGEVIAPLLGRAFLAWFFLSDAYVRMLDWDGTVTLLALAGVPAPPAMLFVAIATMVLGSLSLLLGFRTQLGALALFAFTLIATVFFHAYWEFNDPQVRAAAYEIFARNVAVAGGLLILIGMGPGKFAFDNLDAKGGRR